MGLYNYGIRNFPEINSWYALFHSTIALHLFLVQEIERVTIKYVFFTYCCWFPLTCFCCCHLLTDCWRTWSPCRVWHRAIQTQRWRRQGRRHRPWWNRWELFGPETRSFCPHRSGSWFPGPAICPGNKIKKVCYFVWGKRDYRWKIRTFLRTLKRKCNFGEFWLIGNPILSYQCQLVIRSTTMN